MQKAPKFRIEGLKQLVDMKLDFTEALRLESDIELMAKTHSAAAIEAIYGQILVEFKFLRLEGTNQSNQDLVKLAAGPIIQKPSMTLSEEVSLTALPSLTQEKCPKCQAPMLLFEKQTRSADEGASIIHVCTNKNCKYTYTER